MEKRANNKLLDCGILELKDKNKLKLCKNIKKDNKNSKKIKKYIEYEINSSAFENYLLETTRNEITRDLNLVKTKKIKNELKLRYNYDINKPFEFKSKNKNFNINEYYFQKILEKYEKQKNFLLNSTLEPKGKVMKDDKKSKKIISVSYSANHSKKYYAELQNLIDYYVYNNNLEGYIPIFFTITLDGCYRDFLVCKYDGFNAKRNETEIPKDLRFKYRYHEQFFINDLVKVLNYQHKKMRDRYLNKYKYIKHDYVKVVEPHKNGVPHLHCVWFIPNDDEIFNYLKKIFFECCPAPRHKSTDKISLEQIKKGETNCIQKSINNSMAYIMKYLQKTFRDVKNNKPLSRLNAWYMLYKVRRFTRSFIVTDNKCRFPLHIWRKIGIFLQKYLFETESVVINEKLQKFKRKIKLCEFLQYFYKQGNYISYNFNKLKAPIYIDIVCNYTRFFYYNNSFYITKIILNKEVIQEKINFNSYLIVPKGGNL